MAVLLYLLLIPFVFLASVLLTMAMGLPTLFQAIITGVVMLAYLFGLAALVIRTVLRAGRRFDSAMAQAGLTFAGRAGTACSYRGTISGRQVTARVTPAFYLQPWRVEMTVASPLGFRIALGSTRPLLDCRGTERVRLDGPLAEVHIHAEQPDDARRRLASPRLPAALTDLVDDLSKLNSWELYLQPDRLWLRARAYAIDDEAFGRWTQNLSALAATFADDD